MVWLIVVLSVGWSKEGDVDYIDPQASAREILESIDVEPDLLEVLAKELEGSIKTLSRSIWMFHRRYSSNHSAPLPEEGKVSISSSVHRKFYGQRMADFFHNAEYGRDSWEGSGLYFAPTSRNFDGEGYDYMLAVQAAKGARFLDYRTGNEFSWETRRALTKAGCQYAGTYKNLLRGPPRCRALGVALARALRLKFFVYHYGVSSPKGCDTEPAFVMLDQFGTSQVLGFVRGRSTVPTKLQQTNFNLTFYAKDFGGNPRAPAGPFAKENFFGCGEHNEDNYSIQNERAYPLDLDYPKKPKKVASCEPPGEIDRLASVVNKVVRF